MTFAVRLPGILGAAIALAACGDTVQPPPEYDYGFVSVSAVRGAGGTLLSTPLGIFYRSTQLIVPTSDVTRDSCAVRTTPSSSLSPVPHVNAGDSITLTLTGGTIVNLRPRSEGVFTLYLPPQDSVVELEPGTPLSVSIPGSAGGFPQATATTLAPQPFTLGQIPTVPPIAQPIAVTWDPPIAASTRMLLFLEYAGLGSTTRDQTLFCSLKDDGAHTIPADLLGGWRNAFNDNRAIRAIRERIAFQDLGQAKLHVTSAFRVEIPNP